MRSFILICNDLGIDEIEYSAISNIIVHGISIQEWSDLKLSEFTKKKSELTEKENRLLIDYLKRCEEILRL